MESSRNVYVFNKYLAGRYCAVGGGEAGGLQKNSGAQIDGFQPSWKNIEEIPMSSKLLRGEKYRFIETTM